MSAPSAARIVELSRICAPQIFRLMCFPPGQAASLKGLLEPRC